MSSVSFPVTRPTGQALIVANAAGRAQPVSAMAAMGFACVEMDDPYSAMAELARRPLVYRALVLGLAGLYREELDLIRAVKRRYPHIDVWLTQTDGRQATLAEGMRIGADGLLADDGLHRIAMSGSSTETPADWNEASAISPAPALESAGQDQSAATTPETEFEASMGEPVLTADELRALLQEQPSFPPTGDG